MRLIRESEGVKDGDPRTPRLDPYLDPAQYWTIGWGHAVVGPGGHLVRGAENAAAARAVYPGGVTVEEAEQLLRHDVERAAENVLLEVRVQLSDHQLCALTSFVFNVGVGILKRSTLLKRLNGGHPEDVPAQLCRFVYAGGVVLAGLKRRRAAEAALWTLPDLPVPAPAPAPAPAAPKPQAPAAPAESPPGFWRSLLLTVLGQAR
jgi:lysozyme